MRVYLLYRAATCKLFISYFYRNQLICGEKVQIYFSETKERVNYKKTVIMVIDNKKYEVVKKNSIHISLVHPLIRQERP